MLITTETEEIVKKRKQFVAQGVSNGCLAIAKEAKGATIIDIEGTVFPIIF